MTPPNGKPTQDPAAPARAGRGGSFPLDGEFQPASGPPAGPSWKNSLGRPQQLLELACKVTQAAWGGVGLLSDEDELVEHIAWGLAPEAEAELRRSTWLVEALRFALLQRNCTRLDDLTEDAPQLEALPVPSAVGPFLALPLHFPGRCRGVLYLTRPPGAVAFARPEEELLQPICTWLEQCRMFEEANFQAQMQLLNRVAQTAAGNLDLGRILSAALRELDRHLPLHVCAVWLLEADADATGPARAGPPSPAFLRLADVSTVSRERTRMLGLVPGLRLLVEQTPFAECLRGGQALYTDWNNRVEHPPHLTPGPISMTQRSATADLRSARAAPATSLAVPMRAGERTVGVLQSLLTRPSGFTRDQIQLLSLVADLLGPAISNCQLFDRLRAAYEELRLTQGQLIQAEKMRALGELASGMAHEFNNSLCGVLGFLELALLNKNLDPSGRGYLESARTCALDATETVRRVQDFARRQQDELSVQLLDLNELTRQTLELTRHKWEDLVHARGVPIELEVRTEAAGRVAGSPTELREVLTNLVFNAVDAMPEGGCLRVRTWSTSTDAYLSVEDTGVGIHPSIRHRLFEPFFTTKGERGNGLGLSVVFGIVRRHRGEIGVESALDEGSTFTVRLPLSLGEAKATDPPPAPPVAISRRPALRVLVIEDDDNVRQFLGKGLTALGHLPLLTNNGREGLSALGKEGCDVVLTDLGLPGMSGEEVARRVAEESPGTPVIVLTGWADQLRAERCTLQGVAGILGKPVALDALAASLASVCPSKS